MNSDELKTGFRMDTEELAEIKRLLGIARSSPVMTMRSDLPTFAEQSWRDVHRFTHAAAIKRALPDGSFFYGIDNDGEFTVQPQFIEEFHRLMAYRGLYRPIPGTPWFEYAAATHP